MLQCAFIGGMGAATGLRTFVFETAVDFTCTNLVQHQTANYAIVEMEEVRVKRKARHINN